MKVLYFDCFSGISGDMILGALLDLGIDRERFTTELSKLNLGGYELAIEKTLKQGISVTDVKVIVKNKMEEHSQEERNLLAIEFLIDKSSLSERVKHLSKETFREIAEAEAKVHNTDIYDIHFYEVGAVDSIVDVVGACICLELLNIERVYCSSVHDDRGLTHFQYGTLQVPVTATSEMLAGSEIPSTSENIPTELITPTGLGIVKTLSSYFGIMPQMYIEKVGYGAGKKDTGSFNALRVFMGSVFEHGSLVNDVSILETNLHDSTTESVGYVFENY